mgnify:CR=1 FL=1
MIQVNDTQFYPCHYTDGKVDCYEYEDYEIIASIYYHKNRWRYSIAKKAIFGAESKHLPEYKRRLETDCRKLVEQLNKRKIDK